MKNLNGYILMNEKHRVLYLKLKNEDVLDLTIPRVLKGKEFIAIDLSKVNDDAVRYFKNNRNEQLINPDNYTFELIGGYWQVKDNKGKIITQLPNNDSIKDCYFKYYGDDMFIAYEQQDVDGAYKIKEGCDDILINSTFETKFRLVNKRGEIISPSKEYFSMKPIINTDAILCLYTMQSQQTHDGWLEVYDIINKQGKILFENILVFQVFDPNDYLDFDNYEELPIYYLDKTEDNIKKFEDANWKNDDLNMIDEKVLKAAEGANNG